MSWVNKPDPQRARALLTQAFQEAQIEKRDSGSDYGPSALLGTNAYWQETSGRVELVVSSIRFFVTGRVNTTIDMQGVAEAAAAFFQDDAEAVQALVDLIAHLKHTLITLLPHAHHNLLARALSRLPDDSSMPREFKTKYQTLIIKTMDKAFASEDRKLRTRLRGERKQRGGNTRTKPAWRDPNTLKLYARRVNERKLLAACMKEMFDKCEGADDWLEDLKRDSNFQLLSSLVSEEIVMLAVRRVADDDLSAREREPLSIACEMARRELELPEQGTGTLRDYHGAGERLLKQDRTQQKH